MAASATAAVAGFKIVILLSLGSFQAIVPTAERAASPPFPDTETGVGDFVVWLRPRLPADSWNPPPRQFCVVGARPFSDQHPPYLPVPLYNSKGPLHGLEPYVATFHYITPDDVHKGIKRRSLRQALSLCAAKPP